MNTLYHLLAEYESIHVPLTRISEKYLNLSSPEACRKANAQSLPFPSFKADGLRSVWMVDLRDMAEWLDRLRTETKRVHRGG